jgi:hypothetical protein
VRIRFERLGERTPLVEPIDNLRQGALEFELFHLLDERPHRLDERDPGRDQRRQLTRHHRDVLDAHAPEERQRGLGGSIPGASLVLLASSGKKHPFSFERCAQRLGIVGIAHPVGRPARCGEDPSVLEDCHRSALLPGSALPSGPDGCDLAIHRCRGGGLGFDVLLGGREDFFHARHSSDHLACAVVAKAVHPHFPGDPLDGLRVRFSQDERPHRVVDQKQLVRCPGGR